MSMLSPVVGQDIYAIGQSIAELGETEKSWERVWAVGKPEIERELGKPKGYSCESNPEVRVVLAEGTPPEQRD